MSTRVAPALVLSGAFLIYLAWSLTVGRFTATDEVAFKSAGREWAQSGHFAAPEIAGWGSLEPPVEEIFLAQMPVYAYAFGIYTKLIGFGYRQNLAFDALIHLLLALATFAVARCLDPESKHGPWPAAVAALALLPIQNPGRADEMGMALGMIALAIAHAGTARRRLVAAGAVLGIAGATAPVAAAILGVQIVLVIGRKPSRVLTVGTSAIVTFAAALAPVLVPHPEAWTQFAGHSRTQIASPAVFQNIDYAFAVLSAWRWDKPFVCLVAMAIVCLVSSGRRQAFLVPVTAVSVMLLFLPIKSYYWWFVGPLILAQVVVTVSGGTLPRLALAAVVALYAVALVDPVRKQLILLTLPEDQRVGPAVAVIRQTIPGGSSIAASEFWSSLANDYEYRSLTFAARPVSRSQYVVRVANGSGMPGLPQPLPPADPAAKLEHAVIVDRLNRRQPSFAGVPLSHSAWGYGPLIQRVSRDR